MGEAAASPKLLSLRETLWVLSNSSRQAGAPRLGSLATCTRDTSLSVAGLQLYPSHSTDDRCVPPRRQADGRDEVVNVRGTAADKQATAACNHRGGRPPPRPSGPSGPSRGREETGHGPSDDMCTRLPSLVPSTKRGRETDDTRASSGLPQKQVLYKSQVSMGKSSCRQPSSLESSRLGTRLLTLPLTTAPRLEIRGVN